MIRIYLTILIALLPACSVAYAQQPSTSGAESPVCEGEAAVRAEMADMLRQSGPIELVSWIYPLSAEDARRATVSEDRLTFPREGNPWLSCIEQGDVLWSLVADGFDDQFARRVVAVQQASDAVTFRTHDVSLPVVQSGVRAADRPQNPVATRLHDLLPETVAGGLRRSFVEADDDGYGVSYSGLDGAVTVSLLPLDEQRLAAVYDHVTAQGGVRKDMRGDRAVYLADQGRWPAAHLFLENTYVRLMADGDADLLVAVLDAVDLDAVEGLLREAD